MDLINVLVTKSAQAVLWLKNRVNVDLPLLAQLGGHTNKRTHRPSNGMAGAEIIYHIQKTVRSFEKTGRVKILVDTRVKELLTTDSNDRVIGVRYDKLYTELVHLDDERNRLRQWRPRNHCLALDAGAGFGRKYLYKNGN